MNEELLKIRHSASHVLATAVLRLFPDAKLDIGPATENGWWEKGDYATSPSVAYRHGGNRTVNTIYLDGHGANHDYQNLMNDTTESKYRWYPYN